LTFYKYLEKGRALSLAIANPILEVTVILLKPAKNKSIIKSIVIAIAPALLKTPALLVKA